MMAQPVVKTNETKDTNKYLRGVKSEFKKSCVAYKRTSNKILHSSNSSKYFISSRSISIR